MSFQEKKNQLMELVEHTDNELAIEHLLQQTKDLINAKPERDILDDLTPEQRAGLDRALEQANRGEGIPHSEMKKHVAQ